MSVIQKEKLKGKYTIKQLRGFCNISRKELAKNVGIDYNTLLKYENNPSSLRRASYETIEKIKNALGVEFDNIFF